MARKDNRPFNDLRQRRSEVERIGELAGQAIMDVHEAASDPHAQYVLEASTDASPYGFVLDEDDMASDDDTKVPSQQSVKAYVDSVAGPGASQAWMPLTSVSPAGDVEFVTDDDNSAIPTLVPIT